MIYLDWFASAPLSDAARVAMRDALEDVATHGNASSVHSVGRAARARIEAARADVASAVGAPAREIVFTSGGTEAVQLAVLGVGEASGVRAVLVDPAGHPALRSACARLAKRREIPLETVAIAQGGAVALDALEARLAALGAPALVAIGWVQHETGAVADVTSIAARVGRAGGLLVLDAVQALGKVPVDLGATGAVAAALSAHKVGGPGGVGAVWLAAGARANALLEGGGQERGLRAGSENALGIVGFAAAARTLPTAWLAERERIGALRDEVERALRAVGAVAINGEERARVAHACHASVRGVAGEELVAALDLEGFCVAAGPACSSGRAGPSESVRALYPDEPWRASSTLRITLGPSIRRDEVARLAGALPRVIDRVRSA